MPPRFRTFKQRGEWVELKFMAEAARRGLTVSKPHGDSARYDLAVEWDGDFSRVQVKSTGNLRWDAYWCGISTGNGKKLYTTEQVEFLAAYVIPKDAWYIIPAGVVGTRLTIPLYPHRKPKLKKNRPNFEEFREAWHLLTQPAAQGKRERRRPEDPGARKPRR